LGYLICDKCRGYYELQPGESPEDFDLTCKCGGSLHYDTIQDRKNLPEENSDEDKEFFKEQNYKNLNKYSIPTKQSSLKILKIVFIALLAISTIFWLLFLLPIGIIVLLLLVGIIAKWK
jgi:hypothetical protein